MDKISKEVRGNRIYVTVPPLSSVHAVFRKIRWARRNNFVWSISRRFHKRVDAAIAEASAIIATYNGDHSIDVFQLNEEARLARLPNVPNINVEIADGHFFVSFRYDAERVQRMKMVEGSFWDGKHKDWQVPLRSVEQLRGFLLFEEDLIERILGFEADYTDEFKNSEMDFYD